MAQRGRPKKITNTINDIENEVMGGGVGVMESPQQNNMDDLEIDNSAPIELTDEYDIQVIREVKNVDVFNIPKPDTRYAYHYIRKNSLNLTVKTGNLLNAHGGWELVDKAHAERIGLGKQVGNDGLCYVGDLILGFMPKDLYAEKVAHQRNRAKAATADIDRMLKNGKEEPSFTAIHESMSGIQTEKQLGGNFK